MNDWFTRGGPLETTRRVMGGPGRAVARAGPWRGWVHGAGRALVRAGPWRGQVRGSDRTVAQAGPWRRQVRGAGRWPPSRQHVSFNRKGHCVRLIDPAIPLGNFVSILQVTHCGASASASRFDGFQQRFQLGSEFGRRFLRGHLKVADLLDVVF